MIKPEQTTPCISNPHEKAIEKLEVNLNPNDTMSTEKFTHCIYDSPEVYIQTVQAALFCSAITVYIADCAPPTKHIHVVSKSCAGYLFNVNACNICKNQLFFLLFLFVCLFVCLFSFFFLLVWKIR